MLKNDSDGLLDRTCASIHILVREVATYVVAFVLEVVTCDGSQVKLVRGIK